MADEMEIGIRELRRDLGTYVRRAQRGERLTITDRRRPVAVLAPLPENESMLDRLIAEGRATRAEGDPLEVEPFLTRDEYEAILKDLEDERGEDRF
ncbi:MAG: type II toxin-antitoxin system Phd/YefM family antitoxin [Solirubrobacterales bacterium]